MTMGGPSPSSRHGEERPAGTRLEPRRFPLGLTLAALVVFAVCCSLGVWQLRRAEWKNHVLADMEAVRRLPPQSITSFLEHERRLPDSTLVGARAEIGLPVVANCAAAPPEPITPHMTSDHMEWVTRAMSYCRFADPNYDGVWVDRGIIDSSRGKTQPPSVVLAAPISVTGALYNTTDLCMAPGSCIGRRPAPYTLVATKETPPPPGITPTPYPSAADNLQYVGAYAPTWFGLAGVAAAIYAAMLWRRTHPAQPPQRR
jgi:surfeit locus 1 family protein